MEFLQGVAEVEEEVGRGVVVEEEGGGGRRALARWLGAGRFAAGAADGAVEEILGAGDTVLVGEAGAGLGLFGPVAGDGGDGGGASEAGVQAAIFDAG